MPGVHATRMHARHLSMEKYGAFLFATISYPILVVNRLHSQTHTRSLTHMRSLLINQLFTITNVSLVFMCACTPAR